MTAPPWQLALQPFGGVKHMEGRLHAVLGFIARSGASAGTPARLRGHALLIQMEDHGWYQVLGTATEAVADSFDKVARSLGLGYRGGPARVGVDPYLRLA